MNALWIITVFDIIDELMNALEQHSHVLAQLPDAEILTVAVVSVKFFQHHHERALNPASQGLPIGQVECLTV